MTKNTIALSELFDIGSSKRVLQSQWTRGGVPFYRGREITRLAANGYVDNELFISEGLFKDLSQKYGVPHPGDIMITAIGTIGNSYIVGPSDRFYFKDASVLWLKKAASVSSEFINYWLKSPLFFDQLDRGNGATVDTLTIQKLKGVILNLPSPEEQRRIVTILDEAFEGIATAKANAEKNLQNARELFVGQLESVFARQGDDWLDRKKPLSALCVLIVDCEHKTAPTQEQGIPSIRTPNIGKGELLLDGVYRVSEETYQEWTRRAEPIAGDLILAREAPAGNVAVIPENLRVCLGQRTVLIRPNREVFDSEFLAYLLLSPAIQKALLAHSRGATVQHVNMKDIRALHVGPIPTTSEQREIVSRLQELSCASESLISQYQRKQAVLDDLKQSLLHRAFNGDL